MGTRAAWKNYASEVGPHSQVPIPPAEVLACSFCGDPNWTAFWTGELDVFVCEECAELVLPALIADGSMSRISVPLHMKALVERVVSRLWRAIAYALAQERRDERSTAALSLLRTGKGDH